MCNLLLIIGCGRSGSCWLGEILAGSAFIKSVIEDYNIFPEVSHAATGRCDKGFVVKKLVSYYKDKLVTFGDYKYYSDKSHPNLWLAEDLNSRIPDVKFLGII